MSRVTQFQIYSEHADQLVAFYEKVFRWRKIPLPGKLENSWLVETGTKDIPGINGVILQCSTLTGEGASRCLLGIEVLSVEEAIKDVVAAGGAIVVPGMHVPGMAFAQCKDIDGNRFILIQTPTSCRMSPSKKG